VGQWAAGRKKGGEKKRESSGGEPTWPQKRKDNVAPLVKKERKLEVRYDDSPQLNISRFPYSIVERD